MKVRAQKREEKFERERGRVMGVVQEKGRTKTFLYSLLLNYLLDLLTSLPVLWPVSLLFLFQIGNEALEKRFHEFVKTS